MKSQYTREELITICDSAVVPYEKWGGGRDTPGAQAQVGPGQPKLIQDFKNLYAKEIIGKEK